MSRRGERKRRSLARGVFLALGIAAGCQAALLDKQIENGLRAYQLGHHDAAEQTLRAALEEAERVAPEDLRVAATLHILAAIKVLELKGRAEAEPLIERALTIAEKSLGPEHPDLAQSLNALASLYGARGKLAQAEALLTRALAIREKALGAEHPDVVVSRLRSAAALVLARQRGELAEAESLYRRAVEIQEKAFGPEHPKLVENLGALAMLNFYRQRYGEAEGLIHRILSIQEKALGPEHPDIARVLANLLFFHARQGKYGVEEGIARRALAIREKALSREPVITAEPLFRQSLETLDKAIAFPSVDAIGIAVVLFSRGQHEQGEALFNVMLAILANGMGPEHPAVTGNLLHLAELHLASNQYRKAEPLLRWVAGSIEKAQHPDLPRLLERYATVLRKTGREAEAAAMEARAKTIRAKHSRESPAK